jgi:hypothetical protein
MSFILEYTKWTVGVIASYTAEIFWWTDKQYLELSTDSRTHYVSRSVFDKLTESQQTRVRDKVWELEKLRDCTFTDFQVLDPFRYMRSLTRALSRLNLIPSKNLHRVSCLASRMGDGYSAKPQYFSLSDRSHREPVIGRFGYINGMGNPNISHTGQDAKKLSTRFLDSNNVFVTYNATHQKNAVTDYTGFLSDAFRMKAVDGGSSSKASFLLAQQWIDYLVENPHKYFLQMAHCEGAVHTNAALRIIKRAKPELLSRIRVLSLCPANFIDPKSFGNGLQVLNFVKKEDRVINPWAIGSNQIGYADHIKVVKHTNPRRNPHSHVNKDFSAATKEHIAQFMRTGDIYNI